MSPRSRRDVLAALGASTAALAGCSSDSTDTTTTPTQTRNTETPPTESTPATQTTTTTTSSPTTTSDATSMPRTGPPTAGVDSLEDSIPAFMREWDIPGGTVAVIDDGQLVFARGYGLADRNDDEAVRPDSLFRIGSLSKPITGLSTLGLVERGDLALEDRMADHLSDLLPEDGPADQRVSEITVRNLLRHTAGWDKNEIGFDPMFAPETVARERGTEPPASAETTARFALGQSLGYDPGTEYQYENVGYCLLGRVIEAATDRSYESHVQDALLDPLGASRMQVGATRRAGRLDDEVRYHGHQTVESPFPNEGDVPRPYAAAHLPANDADGGWVGSVVDLLRIARGLSDGDETTEILAPDSIETMTQRPDIDLWAGARQYYGMGWYVVPGEDGPAVWHNGSLPGSYGFMLYDTAETRGVATLYNTRAPDDEFRQFNVAAQQTLLNAAEAVDDWPDRDLFGQFE